jgi:FKBP-type peptidyl-prolyl cis-trans isomerase SlyD
MSTNTELTQVAENLMVTLDYTLTVDDQIVDSSEKNGPIQFVHGNGEIIPGLDRQLEGLEIGIDRKIIVSPEEGYGIFQDDRLVDFPRDQFPENIPLELGTRLALKDQDGNPLQARIYEIKDDSVILDFNHIFAGKELQFDVNVKELRPATLEELENDNRA